jgi:hypothetical protein
VSSDVSLPIIDLPHTPSIQSKLLRFGLDPLLAKTISNKYTQRCEELRSRAQTTLHRACVDLARVPRHQDSMPLRQLLDIAVSMHSTRYLQSLGDMEQRAMAFASKLPSQKPRRTSKCTEKKPLPAFNRVCPFLILIWPMLIPYRTSFPSSNNTSRKTHTRPLLTVPQWPKSR